MRDPKFVYPVLSKAGVGNEIFTLMRAYDVAASTGAEVIKPRWMRLRVGPVLRGERDRRQYWRLFRAPTFREYLTRTRIEFRLVTAKLLRIDRIRSGIVSTKGMADFFSSLERPGPWYRQKLAEIVRPGVIQPRSMEQYLSVHVRLGDFSRATQAADQSSDNTSTPIAWFVDQVNAARLEWSELPVVVSSDGNDDELAELLNLRGVHRSNALNALDEIDVIAGSVGLVGSRSTFSAWGAFLGDIPMLIANEVDFCPHKCVWVTSSNDGLPNWLTSVRETINQ